MQAYLYVRGLLAPPGSQPFFSYTFKAANRYLDAMRSWLRTAFVLLLLFAVATVFLALVYRPPEPGSVPEPPHAFHNLTLSAEGIEPNRVEVEQGSLVVLNLTSVDAEYLFSLPHYGVSQRVFGNETVSVSFLASRVGTFTFQSSPVSPEVMSHAGTLIVTP